jgi:alanine dehydrogenase
LAGKGVAVALQEDVHLRNGLNVHAGMVTHEAVAEALGYEYVEALAALNDGAAMQTA